MEHAARPNSFGAVWHMGKRCENCRPRLEFRALGLGLWDPRFGVAFAGQLLAGAPTQRLGER